MTRERRQDFEQRTGVGRGRGERLLGAGIPSAIHTQHKLIPTRDFGLQGYHLLCSGCLLGTLRYLREQLV